MKKSLVTFTYTKDDGSVSEREALVVSRPTNNFSMIDLTGLAREEVEDIMAKVAEFKRSQSDFYKTVPFKYFTSSKISDLTEIE